MKPIAIITQTYNRLPFVSECISSIINRTTYPYRLFVLDNNSGNPVKQFLSILKDEHFIHQLVLEKENTGIAKPKNKLYSMIDDTCNDDYIVVTDSDIVAPLFPSKCWLERLVEQYELWPNMGMLSIDLNPNNAKPGLNWWWDKRKHYPTFPNNDKRREYADIATGFHLTLIRRKLWDQVGGVEDVGTKYSMVDHYFREKVQKAGYKIGVLKGDLNPKNGVVEPITAYHLGWDDDRKYLSYHIYKKQERSKTEFIMKKEGRL